MKIEEIKNQLKGYFLNRTKNTFNGEEYSEVLCKKISNSECEYLSDIFTPNGTITAYNHLLNQVNQNILDPKLAVCKLDEILPVIDGDIFEDFKRREKIIEKHIDMCNSVETDENQLSENRFLVYYVKRGTKIYAIVLDDSLTEYPANLLDDEQLAKAIRVEYPKLLRAALRDDLINQYDKAYDKEVEKYHSI